jgi:hypothetical protein
MQQHCHLKQKCQLLQFLDLTAGCQLYSSHTLNGGMPVTDEMERMCKGMVYFKILSQHFRTGLKEICQGPQTFYITVAGLQAEIQTGDLWIQNNNNCFRVMCGRFNE